MKSLYQSSLHIYVNMHHYVLVKINKHRLKTHCMKTWCPCAGKGDKPTLKTVWGNIPETVGLWSQKHYISVKCSIYTDHFWHCNWYTLAHPPPNKHPDDLFHRTESWHRFVERGWTSNLWATTLRGRCFAGIGTPAVVLVPLSSQKAPGKTEKRKTLTLYPWILQWNTN